MPTQRAHGGAPLIPINIVTPGHAGLNTENEATILPQQWATKLTNVVFDSAGRAALRKGWVSQTASAVAGVLMRVHEFIKADGTVEIISSTDADIFKGVSTLTSIEGSLAISEGNIKFVNFNNKCIALGTGTSANPSIYTGTGNFTTVSVASGTAPTGRIGTSAYGRLWVVDADGFTIRYCALLDETKWAVVDGGGTIDMSKVWADGQDEVKAIAALAGDLVIFGTNNICIWSDGQGSDIGLNPNNLYISDTITGVGAVTQFALTYALGDLWFLSSSGLQTMSRVLQDKTTPTVNMSRNVKSRILAYLDAESNEDDLSLVYSPREEFMLSIFPVANKVLCFDTRGTMEDGTFRVSEWSTGLQTCAYRVNRDLVGSLTQTVGEMMKHSAFNDDGVSYSYAYESGWLDLGQELAGHLKFVKRMTTFQFVGTDVTINYTINYDFKTAAAPVSRSAKGTAGAQFNVSEFSDSAAGIGYKFPLEIALGESEFSGGVSLRTLSIPGSGSGQYIKIGVNLDSASDNFSLQQINLFAKIGRIAT